VSTAHNAKTRVRPVRTTGYDPLPHGTHAFFLIVGCT
jgi:hypothetical protein